eukprot:236917_1
MATKPKTEAHDFPSHITLEDAMKLSVGDPIDHRDNGGFFAIATVFEKHESKLKIHYDGYSKKYDKWCDVANVDFALPRFAPAGSISQRSSHQDHFRSLKVGDHVDFNPYTRPGQAGWKVGKIIQLGKKRDQVMVEYTFRNVRNTYWTHLDNEKEIAQYKTKQSHSHSTEWEPIDVIKALLWDSDGRSVQWIALKMGRSSADVRTQIQLQENDDCPFRSDVRIVTQILADYFRMNCTGQMNKNELFQRIQENKYDINEEQFKNIIKHLHNKNKVFYIDPMVHQL